MTREDAAVILQAQINGIKANHKLGQLSKEHIQDDYRIIVAFKTAVAALREIDAMYATDNIGESMVKTLKQGGQSVHEIEAYGTLANRREYPQKPTSGLIEEE